MADNEIGYDLIHEFKELMIKKHGGGSHVDVLTGMTIFVAVVENSSLAGAARHMNLSPSVV